RSMISSCWFLLRSSRRGLSCSGYRSLWCRTDPLDFEDAVRRDPCAGSMEGSPMPETYGRGEERRWRFRSYSNRRSRDPAGNISCCLHPCNRTGSESSESHIVAAPGLERYTSRRYGDSVYLWPLKRTSHGTSERL